MTVFGEKNDIVFQCNYCETEVDRFKNMSTIPHTFEKPHKIICEECQDKLGFFSIEKRKIISRALQCLWDQYTKIINENSHYIRDEIKRDLGTDIEVMRNTIFDIDREVRKVDKKNGI